MRELEWDLVNFSDPATHGNDARTAVTSEAHATVTTTGTRLVMRHELSQHALEPSARCHSRHRT